MKIVSVKFSESGNLGKGLCKTLFVKGFSGWSERTLPRIKGD